MPGSPHVVFAVTVFAFFALWVGNALVPIPTEWTNSGAAVTAALFIGLPLVGLFYGTALKWTPLKAFIWLLFCLAGLGLLSLLGRAPEAEVSGALRSGLLQLARLGWPMSLGVLIASLLRDKNLLLPVAIVLATVDLLAVFAPFGTVKAGLQSETIRPLFSAFAFEIPKLGTVEPAAQMGPADPLFLGMFFFAIHRFGMRAKETLYWMLPALVVYLVTVIYLGRFHPLGISLAALPALVPIGVVVVAVNRREFSLSAQERLMTLVVALVCLGLLIASFLM